MAGVVSTVTGALATVLYQTLRPIWLHVPPVLQIVYLITKRVYLRARNISDVTLPPKSAITEKKTPSGTRTYEGSLNNPDEPTMGMSLCPFACNTPPLDRPVEGPPPQIVSEKVLRRPGGTTKTKPLVNLLGGAWIQFMIHDWFLLEKSADASQAIRFPLPDGQTMTLQPAVVNKEGDNINGHDHWWSGCQIYGPTSARNEQLRTKVDGKLKLSADGKYLPLDDAGVELVGFNLNLWSGLQLLHFIFAKEHNAVCDLLKAYYPTWDDERLFSTARKIVTALIARIHTVEWTTAIVQHPAGRAVQYFLWYGILGTLFKRKLLKLGKMFRWAGTLGQVLFGIPGGPLTLAGGKPFAHSEEFVMVYRMHPLLPDRVALRKAADGSVTDPAVPLSALLLKNGTQVNTSVPLPDLLTTLGTGHAGALELRNHPTALQRLETPSGALLDMGAVDVYRSRESRLPLFNDFRKSLGLAPYKSIDELGYGDEAARAALRELYGGDVDKVDVMVGLLAEKPLPGFIFGEAIYTIFVLQTQRRLESDRFYTQDYNEETYTKIGLDWIESTSMTDLLRRHVPELQSWLPDKHTNAFIPWENQGKRQVHEKVIWDLIFPGRVKAWLRNMGYHI